MPVGNITRGTTNPNRLRRVDRWLQTWPGLRRTTDPLIVDLGFGSKAVTTLELATRLSRVRKDIELVGIEIDPARVETATREREIWQRESTATSVAQHVRFELGGFEVPTTHNRQPVIIRAFNVLRQYNEADVASAWRSMQARLQSNGVLVDGTCDELGRISSWIALTPDTAHSLTISLRLAELELPSIVAERLPKALIHRNVPGERIHTYLTALDQAWLNNVAFSSFGVQQRWLRTITELKSAGWPIQAGPARWKLGEVTVDYSAVAPDQ